MPVYNPGVMKSTSDDTAHNMTTTAGDTPGAETSLVGRLGDHHTPSPALVIFHTPSGQKVGYGVSLPRSPAVVGRSKSSGASICLPDERLSRAHAKIRTGRNPGILDLGSRNGTFVDGAQVSTQTWTPLVDGNVVRFADTLVVYRPSGCPDDRAQSSSEGPHVIPGQSQQIAELRQQIAHLAELDAHVLVWGETGTGKEYVSRALHDLGPRCDGPFVAVNCGELKSELISAELFGTTKGAYTNAVQKIGLVAQAANGTLFLDEIGDLDLAAQKVLLRFLDCGEYRAVGGTRVQKSEARIVAATHVDLNAATKREDFRLDVLARLRNQVEPLWLPPLQERPEDLPIWIERFIQELTPSNRMRPQGWTTGFLETLALQVWSENLRELRRTLNSALKNAKTDPKLSSHHLPDAVVQVRRRARQSETVLEIAPAPLELTCEVVTSILREESGNMVRAAQRLGINRRKIYRLRDRYEIDLTEFR